MATSVELQQELNELMAQASGEIERQNKLYRSQAEILGEITKALKNFPSFKDKTKELDETAEALKRVSQGASNIDQAQDMFNAVTDAVEQSSLATDELGADLESVVEKGQKLAVLASVASVAAEGFRFTANAARGLVGFAGEAIKSLGKFAISVISFPFKVLSGLIHMADSGGGSNELQQALEDIRKEFGYLDKTAGGAIVSLSRSMGGELANTGLSVYKVFGNLAERLKYVAEYAKALGPVFDTMASRLGVGGVEALGAYNKALGLTAEAQKGIAARAMASGRTVNEVNQEIANYSIQLSEAFGVTMKEVSRSVGEMMHDFEHFGHLAPKELTQVAVYARKLGIEVKALAGIMDKTLNFEDAATQAAHLSQAFGLNIDAMAMMREQDPGKQLDMLRKSFFATGRSIETMTRQERRLLSQQTGLDDAALGLAFSLKNQGLSYDQVSRKGDAAKKKQLTQAEALEKLSGAIERLVQSGSSGSGGFFDRFLQGFETGIKRSREFREIMMNLRRALKATYRAGIEVGRAFVEFFPGVKDVFKGIADFFSPTKFRTMLRGTVDAFKDFFKNMTSDPQTALPKLFERLKTGFFNYFQSNSSQGSKIINGVKAFGKALVYIGFSAIKIAVRGITHAIPKLLSEFYDLIKDIDVGAIVRDLAMGFQKISSEVFGPANMQKVAEKVTSTLGSIFTWATSKEGVEALKNFASSLLSKPQIIVRAMRSLFDSATRSMSDINFTEVASRLGGLVEGVLSSLIDTAGSTIREGVNLLFDAIESFLSGIEHADPSAAEGFFQGVIRVGQRVLENLGPVIETLITRLPGVLERLQPVILGAVDKVFSFFESIPGRIAASLDKQGSSQIGAAMGRIGGAILRSLAVILGTGPMIIGRMLRSIPRLLAGAVPILARLFTGIGDAIINAITQKLTQLFPRLTFVWEGMAEGFRNVLDQTVTFFRAWFTVVTGIMTGLFDFITSPIETTKRAYNGAVEFVSRVFGVISDLWSQYGDRVINIAKHPIDSYISYLTGLKDFVVGVFHGMVELITGDFTALTARMERVGSALRAPFETLMNVVRRNHEHSVNTIVGRDMDRTVNVVDRAGNRIASRMNGISENVTAAIQGQSTEVRQQATVSTQAAETSVTARQAELPVQPLSQQQIAGYQATLANLPVVQEVVNAFGNIRVRNPENINKVTQVLQQVTALGSAMTELSRRGSPEEERVAADNITMKLNDMAMFVYALPQNLETLNAALSSSRFDDFLAAARRSNLRGVSNAITEMVSQVNSISREMANLTPVNLDVGLRRLAQNIGVGNDARYEIKHRNFTINVNLQVKIDAEELERALIERANSRFARLAEQ